MADMLDFFGRICYYFKGANALKVFLMKGYIMNKIVINEKHRIAKMSPMLYGIFFEDINYGGDGGLYGELIANRSFEYYDRDGRVDKHKMCWVSDSGTLFEISNGSPLNEAQTHCAVLKGTVRNLGFCNEGFSAGENGSFDFRMIAAAAGADVTVRIVGKGETLAEKTVRVSNEDWSEYSFSLAVKSACERAYLEISSSDTVRLAFTSLFPGETYKGRVNGMRKDIAEMIAELHPAFMRFPGGCVVEGRSFENMYCWKDTVGPVEKRRTNWNRWQMEEYSQEGRDASDYFQSYGIGFYEYFLFCEDIGAIPVPVVNCGMTCQWHEGLTVGLDKLKKWVDDVIDLVEFANGSVTSKWGAIRAEMGHPEPFGLEYIGIGNEQWGTEYFERYEIFEKTLSERCPDIKLIVSAGWTDSGEEFDTAMDWMRGNKGRAYAADEHFYKSPEWFMDNVSRYDDYDRSLPKVFIGEYAAHTDMDVPKRRCNWQAALSEAAFLTGVEKNSDHVVMTCYAPLLAREGHQQWQPDLIWFDSSRVYGTPSYYVQKLFSVNSGGSTVHAEADCPEIKISANVSEDGTELILKAVNVSDKDIDVEIIPDEKYSVCSVTELAARPEDENSMDEPTKVSPVESVSNIGAARRLKAYSLNVFKFTR